ncbi:MAG: DUF2062 domain-containing protein [Chromatiaceae bacterium]|nr:DUF2062 domain-containing protein [Chromatiaceae bacterium]
MKRWLKRHMPAPQAILANRSLGIFGSLLQPPNLWSLNRHSVSGGVAVGLFVMYLPPFGQPLLAVALAILLRVNLPISFSLVWLSNPLTIPPMFYSSYLLGCWLLGIEARGFELRFWLDWHNWLAVMAPVLLGSLVCASLCAALGYAAIRMLWRWRLVREIRRRRARYAPPMASGASTPSSSRQI